MNIEFINKEISGLEAEREKAVAQLNMINGAIQAYKIMLNQVQSESISNGHDNGASIEDVVSAVETLAQEAQ